MDPFSITVGIITLIQATHRVSALCRDYTHATSGAARTVLGILDEIESLRTVLESLEQFLRNNSDTDTTTIPRLDQVQKLCNIKDGPIAKELRYLEEKLLPSGWAGRHRSRRKALLQSLTWPSKERQTKEALRKIERHKTNLVLALMLDQTSVEPQTRE